MKKERASGVLCHISSLPSPYGVGDLGPEAFRFVDILHAARQKYWQVLPLNPTNGALGHSPYSSYSAFAYNLLFLSPDILFQEGLLSREDKEQCRFVDDTTVPFDGLYERKAMMLERAFVAYKAGGAIAAAFEDFCSTQKSWLDDHALFVALKRRFNDRSWVDWPVELRDRHPAPLKEAALQSEDEIRREKFGQFLFYRQWTALRAYAARQDVKMIGDVPIYVNYDSADVWCAPEFFKLDGQRRQTFVAGVPPDYFSEKGQRWGNPVYDWDRLKKSGFQWWVDRLRQNLACFDLVRIDHFRAFAQCWEIPASEPTAVHGEWVDVPGMELFTVLQKEFPSLPVIAEDLGIITPDVDELKDNFGLPGMHVLLFAFHNEYKKSRDLPENSTPLSVVYTGTHDNNTVCGWYRHDMTRMEKKNMIEYLGREVPPEEVNWVMIELALRSAAFLALIPVQDILGLGKEARMNTPSTVSGNWKWRMLSGDLTPETIERLAALTSKTGR